MSRSEARQSGGNGTAARRDAVGFAPGSDGGGSAKLPGGGGASGGGGETRPARVRVSTLERVGEDAILGGMTTGDALAVAFESWGLLTGELKLEALRRANARAVPEQLQAVDEGPALDPEELDAVDLPSMAEDEDQTRPRKLADAPTPGRRGLRVKGGC